MKRNSHFHFKHFSVRHDRCSMKVGTDGVLLGAWANIDRAKYILDIGTGSGVIALMLAQRSHADVFIDAVELDSPAASQAKENALASPWRHKISVHHTSLQQFESLHAFDAIVTNPPYFTNSQRPPDTRRIQTRHTVTLDHQSLLHYSKTLLAPDGKFSVILPFVEGNAFTASARQEGLHCTRLFSFRTRPEKPIERWLMEFSRRPSEKEEGEILLYQEGLEWSESYRKLTRDFYLAL